MRQVTVNLTDEQHTKLKQRASETGLLQSEIIRRSLAETLGPKPSPTSALLIARANKDANWKEC
jgi:hypothetical protein